MRLCWVTAFFLMGCGWAQEYTVLQSHTTETLRGVSAVSAQVVWASGTHGTYLRTRDGGRTWKAAQVPGAEGLDFRDVEGFSADTAYLLSAGPGEQSRIYKTTDGGGHWTVQLTNHDPAGFWDCMGFWDSEHGIAMGDPVKGKFGVLTTSDGGKQWNELTGPAAMEGEGAFAASGSCLTTQGRKRAWFVTGGKAARVFRSGDRGKSWRVADAPITHGAESAGVFSVAFRDAKHGVIVGGDYKQPAAGAANVGFSGDGGATWTLSALQPQSYFSAVAFGGKDVLAVGTARAVWFDEHETVARKVWELNLNAVSAARDGVIFGVGANGAVVKFVVR